GPRSGEPTADGVPRRRGHRAFGRPAITDMATRSMRGLEHRQTALLAIRNAKEIASDARHLLEAGRSARALSLAVIGCEEAGKALLHTFAALDLAQNVVAAFEKRDWSSPLLNHLFKHLAVEMIGAADS